MELCRQFYCEENGIFLESYEKYKQKQVTSDYLITMFVEESSPFELNISSHLREHAIKCQAAERDQYLNKIHGEIKLIVQQNILPYLNNANAPI